jgi:uncharacterized protein YidB (DUF937 family)
MSSSSSRWIALLGLLAIAGYQNRDKLGQIFGQGAGNAGSPGGGGQIPPIGGQSSTAGTGSPAPIPQAPPAQSAGGGLLDGLRNIFTGGGSAAGGGLAGGLSEVLEQFNRAGHGDVADSWVKDGPERQPTTNELESALGEDGIDALTRQTGLSRDELLNRLKAVLPAAVDHLTPEGRLPTEAEAAGFFGRA